MEWFIIILLLATLDVVLGLKMPPYKRQTDTLDLSEEGIKEYQEGMALSTFTTGLILSDSSSELEEFNCVRWDKEHERFKGWACPSLKLQEATYCCVLRGKPSCCKVFDPVSLNFYIKDMSDYIRWLTQGGVEMQSISTYKRRGKAI